MTGLLLAGLTACKDPPGAGAEARDEARALAESAKKTASELAARAEEATSKAGEELSAGARKVGDEAGPLLDRLGERLKDAGERLDRATTDERAAAERETRETLGDVKRWLEEDARPRAEKNSEKLKRDIRNLANDLEAKVDRLGEQTGPAAEKTRREIRDGLHKLQAKLRDARDRGIM